MLDLGGQFVSSPLGDPLAPLDRLGEVPVAGGSGVAARGDPHLPPIGPLLADTPGHGISLTRVEELWSSADSAQAVRSKITL